MQPTGVIETPLGLLVVIDDGPDYAQALVMPASFEHRRVVERSELSEMGTLHPAALVLDEQAIERAARAACAYDGGGDDHWDSLMVEDHDWYRALVSTVVAALRNEQREDG